MSDRKEEKENRHWEATGEAWKTKRGDVEGREEVLNTERQRLWKKGGRWGKGVSGVVILYHQVTPSPGGVQGHTPLDI